LYGGTVCSVVDGRYRLAAFKLADCLYRSQQWRLSL